MFNDPNLLIILALLILCLFGIAALVKPISRAWRNRKDYEDYRTGRNPLDPRD